MQHEGVDLESRGAGRMSADLAVRALEGLPGAIVLVLDEDMRVG